MKFLNGNINCLCIINRIMSENDPLVKRKPSKIFTSVVLVFNTDEDLVSNRLFFQVTRPQKAILAGYRRRVFIGTFNNIWKQVKFLVFGLSIKISWKLSQRIF